MTVELITGHAGAAHISSADDGWYHAGTIGSGKYVFDTGTQLAAEVQSANLVTIGVGDALFEGRHVRVSATENVAIDNGAQNVGRHDIICIKYYYDSILDVESASLAVVKGTASADPVDPTIPSGSILSGASEAYMPLWRIPISGTSVGTPEKLYGDVLVTLRGIASKTWEPSQIPNISAAKITSGTLDAARIPNLDASKVTSGTFDAARIPSLDASKITSGTFGDGRIPNLNASKVTAGTFDAARIPSIDASKITSPTWVPKATALYNHATGTTGKVTLSQSAANFNHMRIYFRANNDNNQVGSVDVYSPNGKKVSLLLAEPIASPQAGIWLKASVCYISTTEITRTVSGQGFAGQADDGNTTNTIQIYRVEAWNE